MRIDLRSDTVTRPTAQMKDVMFNALVGDDVFEEDPSIIALEEKAAAMFGHEAALFCPSGTMTNQIAIRLHTQIGSEVICHEDAHVHQYEGGGIAVNSGASVRLLHGNRGRISADQIKAAVNPDDVHKARTSLVCVEDTMNRGGGCYYDTRELAQIRQVCNELNLPLHCDGARVFNAIVERNDNTVEYGKLFDTISVCLSKGLGAPVGSVLIGSKAQIKEARRVRKVFGGGMRQAGYLAAAASYALDNHVERLKEDHVRARKIGEALTTCGFVKELLPVETNIVVFELTDAYTPAEFLKVLEDKDVLAVPFGGNRIRFVTHLDFSDEDINQLVTILKSL